VDGYLAKGSGGYVKSNEGKELQSASEAGRLGCRRRPIQPGGDKPQRNSLLDMARHYILTRHQTE